MLLGGCGGGGGTPPPVNQAPVFTSASSTTVAENQTSAITLTATDSDNDTLTYSISGTDASSFTINSTTGVVTFNIAPDYETKNLYSVIATVTDSSNNTTSQNVTINVTDVSEIIGVFKTGQTTSYATGDDGYYASTFGVDRSFTRDAIKEIVTDNITKLQWQDDVTASTTTANWTTATTSTCQNLTLGGYSDWRLPTIEELESIVNYGTYAPAKYSEFSYMASDDYWSSTTDVSLSSDAWVVMLDYDGGNSSSSKTNSYYVRCVRAGQ